MPSYFDTFEMPDMSIHMMNRLLQRGISLEALSRALMTEPVAGTGPGIMYCERGGGVSAIVNEATGRIITVWRE